MVVGGQAVNLWALFYFEPSELVPVSRRFGSHDLDVLSSKDVLTLLERLPDWKYEKTDWKKFGIGITARAQKVEPDGRRLLVEALVRVAGLEDSDLKYIGEITLGDTRYRLLDPISMLKAKAYNLFHFKQDGEPPRHDAQHLQLISHCVPMYLQSSHDLWLEASAANDPRAPELAKGLATDVSRTFAILTDRAFAPTILRAGVDPRSIIPAAFAESPEPRIAKACLHQMPRIDLALEKPKNSRRITM